MHDLQTLCARWGRYRGTATGRLVITSVSIFAALVATFVTIGVAMTMSASAPSIPGPFVGAKVSQEFNGSIAISRSGVGTLNYRITDPTGCPLALKNGDGADDQCYVFMTVQVVDSSATQLTARVTASHTTLKVQPKRRGFLNGKLITITVVGKGVIQVSLSNISYHDRGSPAIKYCVPPLGPQSPC